MYAVCLALRASNSEWPLQRTRLSAWQIKSKWVSTCKWHRFSLHLPVPACDEDAKVGAEPGERGGRGGAGGGAGCRLQKNTAEGAAATLSLDVLSRCRRLAAPPPSEKRVAAVRGPPVDRSRLR